MVIWTDTSEKRPPKKKKRKERRKERHSNSTVSVSLFKQRLSYFKKVFFFLCLCVKGFATLSSTSEEATSPATFSLLPYFSFSSHPLLLVVVFFLCSFLTEKKKKRESHCCLSPFFFSPQRISARSPTEVFIFSLSFFFFRVTSLLVFQP